MKAFIAMGSNMGDRRKYVADALVEIEKRVGKIIGKSSIIETKAYGYTEQDDFLNLAIEVETELSPRELLKELLQIEKELDRVRLIHWGPRTIDLDIIYYEDQIIDEEDLHIPHIDVYNRTFVLGPIAEIDSEFIDPRKNRTVGSLLNDLYKKESEEFMNSRKNLGMTLGLERIKEALERLGDPQNNLKVIHIGGTNGKGSVATFINNALIENGYKVGITTSPQIRVVNDRFRINNKDISDEDLARYILKVKPIVDAMDFENKKLSSFEIETLFTILYFVDNNVDYAIFEVGLGGRLDSTNVFNKKLLDVFTQIGFDHMGFLGNTLTAIADHKSDIICNGDKVVCYCNPDEVIDEIKRKCTLKNAELQILNIEDIKIKTLNMDKSVFDFKEYKDVEISLLGEHQIKNASLALLALSNLKESGVELNDEKTKNALKNTVWPGRLEKVDTNIILDGAHNIDAVNALYKFIDAQNYNNILVLIGILKDKEYEKVAQVLSKLPAEFITTTVSFEGRELEAEKLKEVFEKNGKKAVAVKNPEEAVAKALSEKDNYDILLVCGSLYLLDEIKHKNLL